MRSHATGRGSEQPTNAQLKELFAQIESGRVTKSRMQDFLRGSTQSVSISDARNIFGSKCVFGPDEWKRYIGDDFPDITVPEIPWSKEELYNPGINQIHFLFLGLDRFRSGRPVNLKTWHSLSLLEEFNIKFRNTWYLDELFSQAVCELRWYLMPVSRLFASEGLWYERQVEKLPSDYEIPNVITRVTASILSYQLIGLYLDEGYWARTRDYREGGSHVAIRAFTAKERPEACTGISIITIPDDDSGMKPFVGISASRKM